QEREVQRRRAGVDGDEPPPRLELEELRQLLLEPVHVAAHAEPAELQRLAGGVEGLGADVRLEDRDADAGLGDHRTLRGLGDGPDSSRRPGAVCAALCHYARTRLRCRLPCLSRRLATCLLTL